MKRERKGKEGPAKGRRRECVEMGRGRKRGDREGKEGVVGGGAEEEGKDNYELVFLSKVFTYTELAPVVNLVDKAKLVVGGTGIDERIKLDWEIENIYPDYSIYDIDYAIGFMTRGCDNNCEWCIVPKKEGKVQFNSFLSDILGLKYFYGKEDIKGFDKVVLLDNNALQIDAGNGYAVLGDIVYSQKLLSERSKPIPKIDFNQGLDIRLVDKVSAELLSKIQWIKYIRFSCDTVSQLTYFDTNLKMIMDNGIAESRFFIYLLVRDIEDAEKRVQFFREKFRKVTIYAQPYRDFENKVEITKIQKEFCGRYIYSGAWRKSTWEEYLKSDSCRVKHSKT